MPRAALALRAVQWFNVLARGRPGPERLAACMAHRILMIEDDASLAAMVGEYLGRLGFTVVSRGSAGSGIEALGAAAEGVRITSPYLPDRPGERNAAFVAAYQRAYDGARPDHRGAGAYDIVHLLARAMDEAGVGRRAVRDYLAAVGTGRSAFEGVTGRIAFDTLGDVPDKPVVIGVVRNGRLVAETSP